jgi:hypothetical protein
MDSGIHIEAEKGILESIFNGEGEMCLGEMERYPPVVAVGHDAEMVAMGDDFVADMKRGPRGGNRGLFIKHLFY